MNNPHQSKKPPNQKNGNIYQFSNHLARGHLAPRLRRRRPHQSKKSITQSKIGDKTMENTMNITHHRRARALSGGLWHDIKVNTADGEFHAFALVFKEGSKYGIGNGRVSKLSIVGPDGVNCYEYDRAPLTPPQSKMAGLVADYIVEMFDIHNAQ